MFILNPFLLHIKSFVKDNLDFLSKCSRENYKDTLLVTFYVVNLSTGISHTFGLEALDYRLQNHQESLLARFKQRFVLECVKFVLKTITWNSIMSFITKCKVQTTIRAIFGPNYAPLSMGYFEIKLYVCICKCRKHLAEYIQEAGTVFGWFLYSPEEYPN